MLLLFLIITIICSSITTTTTIKASPVMISIDWNDVIAVSKTTTTLQVVANPLLSNEFPISEAMFQSLSDLDADFVRYVPWFPYPHYGVAELEPPSATKHTTSWNFTYAYPMMNDFMMATKNHSVIINFSTQPTWLYNTSIWNYPADPTQVFWTYPRGSMLNDPTMKELSSYYARLIAYLTKGGFIDEFGHHHKGHFYDIGYWEVYNEPEGCHGLTAIEYTKQYDAITMAMQAVNPNIKFVGLALAGHNEWTWYETFLNASNHNPKAPTPHIISFHFYAQSSSRTNATTFTTFFDQADVFVDEFKEIKAIRDKYNPRVLLNCDEMGVILPNDNDPSAPMFPLIYWNAAAAMYSYLFARLSFEGIDIMGESQLVGAPNLPNLNLQPQFPSVSLLNWTTAEGNARYWALHTLIRHFQPGDTLVQTHHVDPLTSSIHAQGFITTKNKARKILLINKGILSQSVTLPSDVIGSVLLTIDESTGFEPPHQSNILHTELTLNPFAICVILL